MEVKKSRFKKKDFEVEVLTDYDRTKNSIWEDYEGFLEMYRIWYQYRTFGKRNKLYASGMNRYLSGLVLQMRPLIGSMTKKISKERTDAFNLLFPRTPIPTREVNPFVQKNMVSYVYTDEEYMFIAEFIEDFMSNAGFKRISYARDNRSPLDKLREEKGI